MRAQEMEWARTTARPGLWHSSAGPVSQVARLLDEAVAAFHRRPLTDHYPVLMLDGVVLRAGRGGGLPAPVHR